MVDEIRYTPVVVRAGIIRRGKVFRIPLRKSRYATVRNSISGKWLAVGWIDDRSADRRKIAGQEGWNGNRSEQRSSLRFPQTLKCSEDENLVLNDRSATRCAVLIAAELGLHFVDKALACVQIVVAKEFVDAAVKIVGARPRYRCNDRLPLTEFRREGIAVDLK